MSGARGKGMGARVAIVDTGSGNLRSVERALAAAGADAIVTKDPEAVAGADKIVVPGQGAFGGCVAGLDREGGALRQAVLHSIGAGKPFLGICLGLQILFDSSDEDPSCRGLGVIPGRVTRFRVAAPLKVPHIGWNEVRRGPAGGGAAAGAALGDTSDGTYFYFVHSYYPVPDDPRDVALTTDYGVEFCAAVARDNVFACQFHPEKSQAAGLGLLGRFVASG
jgi:imidazole glycerol-phosphate synthase subunit HisH